LYNEQFFREMRNVDFTSWKGVSLDRYGPKLSIAQVFLRRHSIDNEIYSLQECVPIK